MVDGNLEIKLNLKTEAEEVAKAANSIDTIWYDETTGAYFINDVTEEILINCGFKFFEYSSNKTPIYRKEDVYATRNSDPAFGNITLFKFGASKLNNYEEE